MEKDKEEENDVSATERTQETQSPDVGKSALQKQPNNKQNKNKTKT